MLGREGTPWTLDEYVIVGELWLNRGRSVGVGDADVKALAALLGRTPASISRRVGNFAGTDRPGIGLKPITGPALSLWEKIRGNPAAVREAARNARARLELLNTEGQEAPVGVSRGVRVVDPERPSTEPVLVSSKEQEREAKQEEAVLRESFRRWRDPNGERLRGIEIPTSNSTLRVDLFDTEDNLLIEVKARAERNYLRLAVGQLYDYRRYLGFVVNLAVLIPQRPLGDLMGLLDAAHVGCIWPSENGFATRSEEIRAELLSGSST